MSAKGLYTGGKSKYICGVCLDPHIYHARRQRDMEDHIKLDHARTYIAWINRNVVVVPEQAGHDQDAFVLSLSRDNFMEWNVGSIECDSLKDAMKKIKIISEMPKHHFIKCLFPCIIDGSFCVATEEHDKTFCYPTQGHLQSAIGHIILNAIDLLLAGIVHANLKDLVDIDFVPKYCSLPAEFGSYNNLRANIEIQQYQICNAVDMIVGEGTEDEQYQRFRKRLLSADTIVDLHSILCSAYLTRKRQQPIYYGACRLLLYYEKIDYTAFNDVVEAFRREESSIAASSLPSQKSWMDILIESKNEKLIKMLYSRVHRNGTRKEYEPSPFSHHEFIYNSDRHVNDDDECIFTLEDMHNNLEAVFREYSSEVWEYMHMRGLNAYFGPEEYAYGLLNLVYKLTNRTDKVFYFSPVLQALKMCCIMLAKFHNVHEKKFPRQTPFIQEITVAASEIEFCIKRLEELESSGKEFHNCLLIRIKDYVLKDADIVLFKSIRIVVFALHFLQHLSRGKESTGSCINSAFLKTRNSLSLISMPVELQMQITNPRTLALLKTDKLPSLLALKKITGLNFIISEEAMSTFSGKLIEERRKLVDMLKD